MGRLWLGRRVHIRMLVGVEGGRLMWELSRNRLWCAELLTRSSRHHQLSHDYEPVE